MSRMSNNDLALVLAQKYELSRKVALRFVNAVTATIVKGLEADRQVKVKGLGTFKIVDVDARESVDVNTGERLVIDGHAKLSFLADNTMKELVNKPFSQFETVVLNEGVDFSSLDEAATTVPDDTIVEEETPVVDTPVPQIEEETPLVDTPVPQIEEERVVDTPISEVEEEEQVVDTHIPEVEEDEQVVDTPVPEVEEEEQVVDTPVPEVEEEEQVILTEEEPAHTAEPATSAPWKRWLPVSLLTLALGFGAGFLTARYFYQGGDTPTPPTPTVAVATPSSTAEVPSPTTAEDTPTATDDSPKAVTDDSQKAVTDDSPATTTAVTTTAPADAALAAQPEWEKYNNIDVRTRDGAYFIMGYDRTEKLRSGETTRRLARRIYGGEDMACYIEVYNGITKTTELTAGMEIKIPKLELKKIVRRRLQQQQQQQAQ